MKVVDWLLRVAGLVALAAAMFTGTAVGAALPGWAGASGGWLGALSIVGAVAGFAAPLWLIASATRHRPTQAP